ncbi:MAG TPA: hypothetical protein VGE07_18475 [Herpetosiphonaceae bacterium]
MADGRNGAPLPYEAAPTRENASYPSPPPVTVRPRSALLAALAALHLAAGGGLFLLGLFYLLVPSGPLAAMALVIVMPPAVVVMLLGWGLWRRENWARWLATALHGLNAAGGLALWLVTGSNRPTNLVGIALEPLLGPLVLNTVSGPAFSRGQTAIQVAGILISVLVVAVVHLPEVRAACRPPAARS